MRPPTRPQPWLDPDPLVVLPEPTSELDELESAWRSLLVRAAIVFLALIVVGLLAMQMGRTA